MGFLISLSNVGIGGGKNIKIFFFSRKYQFHRPTSLRDTAVALAFSNFIVQLEQVNQFAYRIRRKSRTIVVNKFAYSVRRKSESIAVCNSLVTFVRDTSANIG